MEVDELRNLWVEQLRNIGRHPDDIDNMFIQKNEFDEWLKLLHQRDPRRSSKLKGNLVPRLPRVMTFRFRLGDQCALELSSGLVGVGEHNIQSGDVVALIGGSDFPLVLRPYRKHFRFVGCAYVWGAMEGDMWPEEEDAKSFLTRWSKFRPDKALRGDEKGLRDIAKSMITGFIEQGKDQGVPPKQTSELEEFVLM
ncbi:hypothetical protein N431DRAFT_469970 [Stipitochalara longipes BDJ]|nr:hypothetical protein N431DRAFT_469970 [Stipitochalara longipes BDJ]